jgi:hypothetical protein
LREERTDGLRCIHDGGRARRRVGRR